MRALIDVHRVLEKAAKIQQETEHFQKDMTLRQRDMLEQQVMVLARQEDILERQDQLHLAVQTLRVVGVAHDQDTDSSLEEVRHHRSSQFETPLRVLTP